MPDGAKGANVTGTADGYLKQCALPHRQADVRAELTALGPERLGCVAMLKGHGRRCALAFGVRQGTLGLTPRLGLIQRFRLS